MQTILQIFGFQGWEWLIIMFVILLLFGANKIPEIARSIGRALGEFQKARMEVEREIRAGLQQSSGSGISHDIQRGETSTTISPPSERERLLNAAKALGVEVREGATEEEIREALRAAVKNDKTSQ